MRAVIAALVLAGTVFGACGGDDDADTATTGDGGRANTIDVDKDKDAAFDAFKRQTTYLSDGQASRAYDEIHPAQRALFTKDQYVKCQEDAADLDDLSMSLKEAYLEKDLLIIGTTERADAIALTVDLKAGTRTATDTFHEFKVNGKWNIIVSDPQEIIDGTC